MAAGGQKIIPVMKKLLLLASVLMLSFAMNAQEDVTKFLGIPVDGTKSEMINKLLAKGFTRTEYDREVLEGEFNGMSVVVNVQTNNNKVWRIMVFHDAGYDEANVRILFNNLVHQFADNSRYMPYDAWENFIIPDDEDFGYEISVHNKRYEATFLQYDYSTAQEKIQEMLQSKYTPEELESQTEEMRTEKLELAQDLLMKKVVWFMIGEQYGRYSIVMFYENGYNKADGSDL